MDNPHNTIYVELGTNRTYKTIIIPCRGAIFIVDPLANDIDFLKNVLGVPVEDDKYSAGYIIALLKFITNEKKKNLELTVFIEPAGYPEGMAEVLFMLDLRESLNILKKFLINSNIFISHENITCQLLPFHGASKEFLEKNKVEVDKLIKEIFKYT